MNETLAAATATELAARLRTRELRAVDVAAFFIEKARAQSSPVYVAVTESRAMAEAGAADRRLDAAAPLSPLDGVPVAWKGLFDIEGEVTTACSVLFEQAPPATADAAVVAKAKAAGMVCLGKLNMTELAYSGIGYNPHYGTPMNACSDDVHYAPGGSSSGCGAAIGRNMAPIAIGTDTGGSVRVPACHNGVTGLKTSEGRYDKRGSIPLSQVLDTIGPLARSVADCAAVDAVFRTPLHAPAPMAPAITGKHKPPLFVPQSVVLDDLDPVVERDFRNTLAAIRAAGYAITEIDLDCFTDAAALMEEAGTITAMDAWHEYKDMLTADMRARMDERVLARILRGAEMTADDLVRWHWLRARGIAEIIARTGSGFMLMPTTPLRAPELAPLLADVAVFHRVNLASLRNTMLGNVFNLPGVAMPMNLHKGEKDPRPTGLLLCTHAGREDALMEVAGAIEAIIMGMDGRSGGGGGGDARGA